MRRDDTPSESAARVTADDHPGGSVSRFRAGPDQARVYVSPQPAPLGSDPRTIETATIRLAPDIDPRRMPTLPSQARPLRHSGLRLRTLPRRAAGESSARLDSTGESGRGESTVVWRSRWRPGTLALATLLVAVGWWLAQTLLSEPSVPPMRPNRVEAGRTESEVEPEPPNRMVSEGRFEGRESPRPAATAPPSGALRAPRPAGVRAERRDVSVAEPEEATTAPAPTVSVRRPRSLF